MEIVPSQNLCAISSLQQSALDILPTHLPNDFKKSQGKVTTENMTPNEFWLPSLKNPRILAHCTPIRPIKTSGKYQHYSKKKKKAKMLAVGIYLC